MASRGLRVTEAPTGSRVPRACQAPSAPWVRQDSQAWTDSQESREIAVTLAFQVKEGRRD